MVVDMEEPAGQPSDVHTCFRGSSRAAAASPTTGSCPRRIAPAVFTAAVAFCPAAVAAARAAARRAAEAAWSCDTPAGPDTDYLWILSREKTLAPEIMNKLLAFAEQKGFDTQSMIYVKHN